MQIQFKDGMKIADAYIVPINTNLSTATMQIEVTPSIMNCIHLQTA